MAAPIYQQAHAAAAAAIAAGAAYPVAVDPTAIPEKSAGTGGVEIVITLSTEAPPILLGQTLGGSTPFEFEHVGQLTILLAGGEEAARGAFADDLLAAAETAILADPTLGGLVSYAELGPGAREAITEAESRGAYGWSADLTLTYAAPTKLG